MYKIGVLALVCFALFFKPVLQKKVLPATRVPAFIYLKEAFQILILAASFLKNDTTVVSFEVALYPSTIKENVSVTVGVDDGKRLLYNSSSTFFNLRCATRFMLFPFATPNDHHQQR